LRSELLGRAKERIFGGFFSGVQHLSDGAQAETLVVLEFEDHAFAGSKPGERLLDAAGQDFAVELLGGVGEGPIVGDGRQDVDLIAGVVDDDGLIFAAGLTTPELIEAKVGDDAVDPCVEGALKAEVADVRYALRKASW
jgi:hypothetical protein